MDPSNTTNTLLLEIFGAVGQSVLMGMALTILIALVLRGAAGANAATRFAVWFGTLIVVGALSVAPLFTVSSGGSVPERRVSVPPAAAVAHRPIAAVAPVAEAPMPPTPATRSAEHPPVLRVSVPPDLLVAAVFLYVFVLVVLVARLTLSYLRLRRLLHKSLPAPQEVAQRFESWLRLSHCSRRVRLLVSSEARSPMAVGFLRPAVVIPDSLLLQLTGEDLDNAGLHELAHLCRHDDWTNLTQRALRALLFFHPAVHWICRRLDFEREVACDDRVLAITEEPKSYARSLTRILEIAPWRRRPLLASEAVLGRRQIFRRIKMMLDGGRDRRPRISQVTLAIVLVVIVGIASELAQMPSLLAFHEDFGGNTWRWVTNDRSIETKMRGEVEFGEDDASIVRMAPDAYFRLEEKRGWTRRRLEARGGPTPELRFTMDGAERPFDDAARDWVRRILPGVIREAGFQAEERALRILNQRGATGVLDEIDRIGSDHVRRRYLLAVLDSGKLSEYDLRRAMQRVGKISSDHEKANVLIEVLPRYSDEGLRGAYFDAVDTINSDHDRGRVLSRVLEETPGDERTLALAGRSIAMMGSDHEKAQLLRLAKLQQAVAEPAARKAILRAADSIQSDNEKAGVVTSMLDQSNVSADAMTELMNIAAKISSDSDKGRALQRAVERDVLADEGARSAFFTAVNTINADGERAAVLSAALRIPQLDAVTLQEIAGSAQRLSSDNDKANVLIQASGRGTTPAFFAAVRSISSDNDKRRVLSHMLERNASADAAKSIVEAAGTLSSDNDKAEVLMAAAKHYSDPEIREQVRKAAASVHSDSDYRRVMSALADKR
jgi:beta-lactamase regulating signal transducer with metallopeptidase domain